MAKYAGKFFDGVQQGYGKSLSAIDYDTPDAKMLQSLAGNVFHFSAAKNRAEIVAMSSALRDENGKVRGFAEFRREASQIVGEFQGNWLRAEYDLAINAATMAARWTDHSGDANAILRYRTAGDGRVRPEHKLLDGICKPVSDHFWDTYYPPNGWNCRCDAEKTTLRETGDDAIPHRAIDGVPPMFRSNFAKEGMVFPKDHPYFKAGQPTEKELRKAQIATIRDWAKENLNGKTAQHPVIGKVRFTNQGVKEALNQPHQNFEAKNDLIYVLEKALTNAKYVKSIQDGKGRPFTWHYLETKVNNKASYIAIKEDGNGTKVFYTITDAIK